MTEEEKKLIDGFFNKGWCCDLDEIYNIVMKMSALIEKQQVEREDKNKTIEAFSNNIDNVIKELYKNYIPKDKIREKIKEKEAEKQGVKNISLEEYAITSKELKESEICLLKCILEEK